MKWHLIKTYILIGIIAATFFALALIPHRIGNDIDPIDHYIGKLVNPTAQQLLAESESSWVKKPAWKSYFHLNHHDPALIEWFKTSLSNHHSAAQSMVFEVDSPILRSVEVHIFLDGNLVFTRRLGHEPELEFTQPKLSNSFFIFPFTIPANTKLEILTRIETPRYVAKAPIRLHFEREEILSRAHRILIMSLVIGGILGIMLYNLLIYFSIRNSTYLVYVIYHGTLALYLFLATGLIFSVAAPSDFMLYCNSLNTSSSLLVVLGSLFILSLFQLQRTNPRFAFVIKCCVAIEIAMAAGKLLIAPNFASLISHTELLIAFAIYLACIPIFAWRLGAFNLIISWSGLFLGTFITVLSYWNILPTNWLSAHFFMFGALWEAILMTKNLADILKRADTEKRKLREALATAANRAKLNEVFGQSYEPSRVFIERKAAIMFISISGFIEILRQKDAKKVFENLSEVLQIIRANVILQQGMIDRYLGDGILAVFGAQRATESATNHVSAAFAAANSIQEETARLIATVQSHGKIPLPLKIGLHFDQILVGNLGSKERIDFSVFGEGVNFSSRLTHACHPFRILLSKSAKDMLPLHRYNQSALSELSFRIKNQSDTHVGFEYDPFYNQSGLKKEAERNHIKYLNQYTKENRKPLRSSAALFLVTSEGRFQIIDFSLNGICAVSDRLLGENLVLEGVLEESTGKLTLDLSPHYLDRIKVEARWSRMIAPSDYRNGFQLCGLNIEQRQLIFDALQKLNQVYDTAI